MDTQFEIMLVEDDPKDQMFIKRALYKVNQNFKIDIFKDAETAIKTLELGHLPKVIITDLNMPGMGGRGLLDVLKNHDSWKKLPTIVLSTSDDHVDVRDSYEKYANAYIVKPDTIKSYKRIAELVSGFWLDQKISPL